MIAEVNAAGDVASAAETTAAVLLWNDCGVISELICLLHFQSAEQDFPEGYIKLLRKFPE